MKGSGTIKNGLVYFSEKLADYIRKYEGCEVDIEMVALNKPEHYLYRYLCGFLEKDIAEKSGISKDDVSDMFKEKFATEYVDDWMDVPKRHRAKCLRYEREHDNGAITRWYVKSRSSMTHEELQEYVTNVENHFFDFMEGAINKKHQDEANRLRTIGMMNEKEFKKYRREHGDTY